MNFLWSLMNGQWIDKYGSGILLGSSPEVGVVCQI